jgi:peptidoglycan/LPS O-acetylase OafA/YrhL
MDNATRTPTHLWIVGLMATLWNAFGCFDYLMTQTRNAQYLANFTDPQRAYFDSFPLWMEAVWAFGVWGGLAGALLLLARSRYAVAAFAVSLAGLAVSSVYQYVLATPPEDMMTGAMIGMNLALWAVAVGLLVYALRMRGRGVLR